MSVTRQNSRHTRHGMQGAMPWQGNLYQGILRSDLFSSMACWNVYYKIVISGLSGAPAVLCCAGERHQDIWWPRAPGVLS